MENVNSISTSSLKRAASKLRKYMIFSVGGERYAVPLSHVKEVIGLTKITPVPNKPSYFKGLVNLRGQIVAAFDLKARLKIAVKANAEIPLRRPCMIITEQENSFYGAIVDDVTEVISLDEESFDRTLEIDSKENDGVVGVAKTPDNKLTLVLDIKTILNVPHLHPSNEK
jgi:purine-binding chemotaxis protein CheW